MNDSVLSGGNTWLPLDTGSERYTAITAAEPNVLYALQTRGGVRELNKITMAETDCFDGVDNDGNGLKDTEDAACVQIRADSYCSTRTNGKYCASRYQPTTFLGQTNQRTSLVTCTNGKALVQPGVCTLVSLGSDKLETEATLTPADPAGYGHWCNIHRSDGTWDVSWTGATPCVTLQTANPGSTIVRAGVHATSGKNQVLVNCNNGWVTRQGNGTTPLTEANNAVGHTSNRCLFTISPAALPIFNRLFDVMPGRGSNPFTHHLDAANPIPLAQFGNGDPATATATAIDRFGKVTGNGERAYDHLIDEGRPVYAAAGGIVVPSGSRDLDISAANVPGTPFLTDLYIQYSVGTDSTYREYFVGYIAHMRKRLVVPNQSV
jgi:hypothetical protein